MTSIIVHNKLTVSAQFLDNWTMQSEMVTPFMCYVSHSLLIKEPIKIQSLEQDSKTNVKLFRCVRPTQKKEVSFK